MIYNLQMTSQFKKDLKLAKKRGCDLEELSHVLEMLQRGAPLPADKRDHGLVGEYIGFRECHIRPDWLLVYYIQQERLVLVCVRTGSHSDIFA